MLKHNVNLRILGLGCVAPFGFTCQMFNGDRCSGSKNTSRCQHSPTAARAGRASTQGRLVFELRLHDRVMFVFQVQQDGSELLILTQILKSKG